MSQLEKQILQILAYFSVFSYPISFYKLVNYLNFSDFTYDEILKILQNLIKSEKIKKSHNLFFLPQNKEIIDFETYTDRKNQSLTALQKTEKVCGFLSRIPWIKMLAVTGSVAAFNKTKNDDIDIFIISQKNRLWITRFFVFLILKTLNLYRTDKNHSNKICPNLFIAENNLAWRKDHNIYVAFEILSMFVIINRANTYFKFLNANLWIKDYFQNFYFYPQTASTKYKKNFIMEIVEIFFKKFQLTYMKSKKTSETVSSSIAHFNKNDNKEKILDAYMQTLRATGLTN